MTVFSTLRNPGSFNWNISGIFHFLEITLDSAFRARLIAKSDDCRVAGLPIPTRFASLAPAFAGNTEAHVTRKEKNRDRSPERKGNCTS